MKKSVLLLVVIFLLTLSLTANASIYGNEASGNDLTDQRTFGPDSYKPSSSEGGLGGYWPFSFDISWNVSQDISTNLWTYEYTLSATLKEVSHFIIEVSDGAQEDDFSQLSTNGRSTFFGDADAGNELDYWGTKQGKSNPGYPSVTDLYGIKFDSGELTTTYQLTTYRSPVWGNFYAKSGKDKGQSIYAYNTALAITDFDSDKKIDFIVRPNGTPIVPEPASVVLFLTGSAALGFRSFRKRKKK